LFYDGRAARFLEHSYIDEAETRDCLFGDASIVFSLSKLTP
jgi:hypothetical protein